MINQSSVSSDGALGFASKPTIKTVYLASIILFPNNSLIIWFWKFAIEQKNIKNGTHVFFSFGNDLPMTSQNMFSPSLGEKWWIF